jgi:crossover junction endodeoxyribonuclease RuvC
MIILGVDTAMRCTGYGVLDVNGDNFQVIDCGIIKNPQKLPHSECLRRLSGGIRELLKTYKIDAAAIESAFYYKSVRTTMVLGYARGCVMTVLAENNVPIYPYSPKEVKLSAAGTGNASKNQVAVVLGSILGINIENLEDDATDALGLAMCHANRISRAGAEIFMVKPT